MTLCRTSSGMIVRTACRYPPSRHDRPVSAVLRVDKVDVYSSAVRSDTLTTTVEDPGREVE